VPSAPFVVPPLLLVVILAISAVAKIRVPRDTASVFHKLRLPAFLSTVGAPRLLPYGELVVAAMLVLLPGGWYVVATTLALVLFAVYLVVVVRARGFGFPLLCGCFGKLGLGWITRQTVVRNAVLLAVAAIAWVDSWRGDGVLERLRGLGSDGWWLAGVALAIVTTAFVVRDSKLPPFVPPEPGDDEYLPVATSYSVLDGPEGPRSVWQLSDAAARLLVFWDADTDDEVGATLAERLPTWQEQLAPVRVHLVSPSEWAPAAARLPDLAEHLLGDPEGEAIARLGVPGTPGAVLLGTDRYLAGGPVVGLAEIEELVSAAAEEIRTAGAAEPDGATAQS
jgi:hypothetical protein